MIGVVVYHDLIAVPEPAVTVSNIVWGDAEVEVVEPETAGAASRQMPDVTFSNAAGKVAVLPRVIEVVVGVIAAGFVPDPGTVGMDVWSVGVPLGVVIGAPFFTLGRGFGVVDRGRTLLGNVMASVCLSLGLFMLGEGRDRNHQQYCQDPSNFLHANLRFGCFQAGQSIVNPQLRKYQ